VPPHPCTTPFPYTTLFRSVRQDDYAAHDRRLHRTYSRRDPSRRERHYAAAAVEAQYGPRVPELRALPALERGRQRRLRVANAQSSATSDCREAHGGPAPGATRRLGGPPAARIVGRTTAARRPGTRPGDRARYPAARRAAVQSRRQASP